MNPFATFDDWISTFFLLRSTALCVALLFCAFACFGMFAIWRHFTRRAFDERASQPVSLKIVANHPDTIKNQDNKLSYRSEYEIVSGVYQGKRKISEMSSLPPIHMVGEKVKGLYNTKNGEIESLKALGRVKLISHILIVLGLLFLVGAVALWLFVTSSN